MQSYGLQVEGTSTKDWERCRCSRTCKRMKRKDQNSEGRLDTTCECIGTEEVRRYTNDTQEERNTESSNARHIPTRQGGTFKTPRDTKEERNTSSNASHIPTQGGTLNTLRDTKEERNTSSSNARQIPTTQGGTFKTPRETGEGRNSGEQLDTIARSPDSLVEDRSGGKTLNKEEKSRQKSKLWWKKRETMENKKKASMVNLTKRVYTQESIHEEAYWKRRDYIEKKPFDYYSARKEQTEEEERKTTEQANRDSDQSKQSTWKGLTLTGKGAEHDQRNRKKWLETQDRLVALETVKEERHEEMDDGETFTERYARYKQEGGIEDKREEQPNRSDKKERQGRWHREENTNEITKLWEDDLMDSDIGRAWLDLQDDIEEERDSSEEEEPHRQKRILGDADKHIRARVNIYEGDEATERDEGAVPWRSLFTKWDSSQSNTSMTGRREGSKLDTQDEAARVVKTIRARVNIYEGDEATVRDEGAVPWRSLATKWDSRQSNTSMTGRREGIKLDTQDEAARVVKTITIAEAQEQRTTARKEKKRQSRAIEKAKKRKIKIALLVASETSKKDSDDESAEHKETTEARVSTPSQTNLLDEVPRAPRLKDLRGLDMQWWEEDIARYRADQKGYAYAKDINNYYAELKGVEDEIKAAQESGSTNVPEEPCGMTNSERGAKEGKDTIEMSTPTSEGAGEEKLSERVRRTIGGKGVWRHTVEKQTKLWPTITWTWATYVKDLITGRYRLVNTSNEKSGKTTLKRRSQGAGRASTGEGKKRVEGARWYSYCYDQLIRSRLAMSRCVYVDDVHAVVNMYKLFVVETPGFVDHDNHAG